MTTRIRISCDCETCPPGEFALSVVTPLQESLLLARAWVRPLGWTVDDINPGQVRDYAPGHAPGGAPC
jgi:hypothetical protein